MFVAKQFVLVINHEVELPLCKITWLESNIRASLKDVESTVVWRAAWHFYHVVSHWVMSSYHKQCERSIVALLLHRLWLMVWKFSCLLPVDISKVYLLLGSSMILHKVEIVQTALSTLNFRKKWFSAKDYQHLLYLHIHYTWILDPLPTGIFYACENGEKVDDL